MPGTLDDEVVVEVEIDEASSGVDVRSQFVSNTDRSVQFAGLPHSTVLEATVSHTMPFDLAGDPILIPGFNSIRFAPLDGGPAADDWQPIRGETAVGDQVEFEVENNKPVLNPIPDHTIHILETLEFTATATDPDAGDTLTFTLTGEPSGATISPDGHFQWTPSVNPIRIAVVQCPCHRFWISGQIRPSERSRASRIESCTGAGGDR